MSTDRRVHALSVALAWLAAAFVFATMLNT